MNVATREARFPIMTLIMQLCPPITALPGASHEETRRGRGGVALCSYMLYSYVET